MSRPFAITLDPCSSLANRTGNWRNERPVYVDLEPPCNRACPAGEHVQAWLYRAEEGDYEGAWRQLVEVNPLPAVMGRVCYRPCETACNRAQLDEAVGINSIERFLGDEAIRRGWRLPEPAAASGKKVLVVGAGPCGLSAAYHLRRRGHAVTVVDLDDEPGGMMRAGIPAYRLPRDVLRTEIERIFELGIDLQLRTRITEAAPQLQKGDYDAVVVAVGAQVGHRVDIPAGDSAKILDALSLLRSVQNGEPLQLGRRVAIYGGGDTAFDAARTARRLGATDAVVIYRRNQDRMPAHKSELDDSIAEGIHVRWESTIKWAEKGKVVIEKMRLDETGFPQPTGQFETLEADSVVLAVGQDTDLSLLDDVSGITVQDGVVQVGADLMTGHPGIFAGGDAVPGERSVTTAVGHGRRVAERIDSWLQGASWAPDRESQPATFDRLNTWYYSDAPRTVQPELEAARRQSTFDEIVGGLDETNALFEARRCFSCGNCLECDNCYAVCPDNAVIKLGPGARYRIDYDYCKGCGICAAECPCGAINMVPELT